MRTKMICADEDDEYVGECGAYAVPLALKMFLSYAQDLPAHLYTVEAATSMIKDLPGTEEKVVRQWRSHVECLSKAVALTEDAHRIDCLFQQSFFRHEKKEKAEEHENKKDLRG